MAEHGMAGIIPRLEGRTFGSGFGSAQLAVEATTQTSVQESDETYFLGATGHNVKIRGGSIDIKVLQEVYPLGLERWAPVLKAPFPLQMADVVRLCEALGTLQEYCVSHLRMVRGCQLITDTV